MGKRMEDGSWKDECLEKLKHGEPFFVLRAQDKFAWRLVEIWIWFAQLANVNQPKIQRAISTLNAMKHWQNKKIPD